MLSIDFGNNYTKIGIRRDENATAKPLRSPHDLHFDEDNLCIPSLAACDEKGGWRFGIDVSKESKRSRERLRVLRNWKPAFFQDPDPAPVLNLVGAAVAPAAPEHASSPWDRLPTPMLIDFLAYGDLTNDQRQYVAGILKDREGANGKAALSATAQPARQRSRSHGGEFDLEYDYKEIGRGYFAWLKGFVDPICKVNGLKGTDEIPVRITLPSLGTQAAQAQLLLEEILRDTGWNVAQVEPVLAEPVSNLIGTLSEGRNAVWTPENSVFPRGPHYPKMFSGTFLSHLSGTGGIHRIMIADVGGYTADFAAVEYDLTNLELAGSNGGEGDGRLRGESEPIGVHELDRRLRDVLHTSHREVFDLMLNAADSRMLDTFHQRVYGDGRDVRVKQGTTRLEIGKDATERKRIVDCVQQFAQEIAEAAERFLNREQLDRVDELILTGGGCNIPQVREAIRQVVKGWGLTNTYIPISQDAPLPVGCKRLPRLLVRGATALGGTSVFFDYSQ